MESSLPERDYYTFPELARRWRCSEDDIKHYIFAQQILKASVIVGNIYGDKYLDKYEASIMPLQIGSAKVKSPQGYPLDEEKLKRDIWGSYRSNKPGEPIRPGEYYFLNTDYLAEYVTNDPFTSLLGTDFLEDDKGEIYRLIQKSDGVYYYTKLDVSNFRVVVIDEVKRFEKVNKVEIPPFQSNEIFNETISEKSLTTQNKREVALRGYLEDMGYKEGTELELKREDLWTDLSRAAPEIFPPRAPETINEFFKKQKFCNFKPGRRKEG
jgi:hypothetical protein